MTSYNHSLTVWYRSHKLVTESEKHYKEIIKVLEVSKNYPFFVKCENYAQTFTNESSQYSMHDIVHVECTCNCLICRMIRGFLCWSVCLMRGKGYYITTWKSLMPRDLPLLPLLPILPKGCANCRWDIPYRANYVFVAYDLY